MNIFQGGFLGLDNIGVFDRSAPLPTGGYIEQSDGTSWMAMYTLNLLAIAMELATEEPCYEDVASKFSTSCPISRNVLIGSLTTVPTSQRTSLACVPREWVSADCYPSPARTSCA